MTWETVTHVVIIILVVIAAWTSFMEFWGFRPASRKFQTYSEVFDQAAARSDAVLMDYALEKLDEALTEEDFWIGLMTFTGVPSIGRRALRSVRRRLFHRIR